MNKLNSPVRYTTILSLFNPKIIKKNYVNEISDNNLKSKVNDFYTDIMDIICNETYLKNGILTDVEEIEENYGWYIVSTIYFETKLTDEIMLWKYNEIENKWYEKTITARLLLQLNGT